MWLFINFLTGSFGLLVGSGLPFMGAFMTNKKYDHIEGMLFYSDLLLYFSFVAFFICGIATYFGLFLWWKPNDMAVTTKVLITNSGYIAAIIAAIYMFAVMPMIAASMNN